MLMKYVELAGTLVYTKLWSIQPQTSWQIGVQTTIKTAVSESSSDKFYPLFSWGPTLL